MYVRTLFGLEYFRSTYDIVIFFSLFFPSFFPCRETPQNERKGKGIKKYPPLKNNKIFPNDCFGKRTQLGFRVLELPLPSCRETPKNALKKSIKKKKARAYFFLRAGADVRRFPVFFAAPCHNRT
jgi:hypothetical protein